MKIVRVALQVGLAVSVVAWLVLALQGQDSVAGWVALGFVAALLVWRWVGIGVAARRGQTGGPAFSG